jgi:ketosteroid isomerase-like protein
VTDSANLDLVRSIHADWERGDYFTRADWVDPEIEIELVGGPDPESFKGASELAEAWREYLSNWQGYRIKAEEYSQLDGERVLVLFRVFGRGKTSGLELGQLQPRGASVFHVREGKVTRLVSYFDRDRALADLGLASEGDTTG